MANTYVFSGFPGFLASNLVKEIFFEGYPVDRIYLIHLPSLKEQALGRLEELSEVMYVDTDKLTLVEGDITLKSLGLEKDMNVILQRDVTHFFHLAALYDLAIPLPESWNVNVQGTREVNRWLKNCSQLERYIYFSTAYVSGRREGTIYEHELIHNLGFKNHYEYTKYEAERLVEQEKAHLPITIIRPGIAIGESSTGETVKFDGPYFILNMLDRFKGSPLIPYFGEGKAKVNLVPQDYVLKATTYLAHVYKGEGKTYHLTDPSPYTAREIYKMFSEAFINKEPKLTLPTFMANRALKLRPLRTWVGMQQEALAYFNCESEYDTTETQKDLKGSGITCPDLAVYLPAIIEYYEHHKQNKRKHVSIF
ncbi:SDR family oxidoreductase [Halobacillus mangrovi]|uniref:SDR family oxidoreductase n=1 Tax=Halobacillus mangrovi TaxID=402384 RepID=UPI003D95FDBF